MTRAYFVTTITTEPIENYDAWVNTMGPADQLRFDIDKPPRDADILRQAEAFRPDVIFYTGGEKGTGLPSVDTFRMLREIAPVIHYQGDFADPPWWPTMEYYRREGCFDLTVSIDGVKAPLVNYVTLTPMDVVKFAPTKRHKPIHCGFAGNVVPRERYDLIKEKHGTEDPRAKLLHSLSSVVLRPRQSTGAYVDYIAFLQSCQMMINTSWAGSGQVHHVKGRVIEAAFAGCALLEMLGSPIGDWFPSDCYMIYTSPEEAQAIINSTTEDEIKILASRFSDYARNHYTADKIYKGIMEALHESNITA